MTLVANSAVVKCSMSWEQQATNEGGTFAKTKQGPDSHTYSATPSTTTFAEIFLDKITITAGTNTDIDLRTFTNYVATAVTGTAICGIMIKATASVTGGTLTITPGSSNALGWPLSGTSPAVALLVGTTPGACFLVQQASGHTIDATHKTLNLAATSQDLTVTVSALIDPA